MSIEAIKARYGAWYATSHADMSAEYGAEWSDDLDWVEQYEPTGETSPRQRAMAHEIVREDIPALLEEVERLTEANDRLARIASQVSVALEEGKRDLMAHAWDKGHERGFWNGRMSQIDVPYGAPDPLIGANDAKANNPYRGKSEGLEGLEGL